jgi:hypothetical protein
MKLLSELAHNDHGGAAVENALVLAIVVTLVAIAALSFSDRVAESTNASGACITSSGSNCQSTNPDRTVNSTENSQR